MNEEIIYAALSTPQFIAPIARLQLCDTLYNASCEAESTALRVKLLWSMENSSQLALDNSADTCDLDLLSLRAQRKLCGIATENLVELLPYDPPSFVAPNFRNQTSDGIFHFNLSNHWTITEEQLPLANHRLDNVAFTVSFWMNHSTASSHPSSTDEANGREHVLCSADSTEKNRHHFAIYLHNCKMTVLLRREPLNFKSHEEPPLLSITMAFCGGRGVRLKLASLLTCFPTAIRRTDSQQRCTIVCVECSQSNEALRGR
ncbi:hypothetical protein AHF37_09846 [Paragonimus kellicotti]|nr:hypothetical protein AHF37_09846 [Paragonimus kellicotti]